MAEIKVSKDPTGMQGSYVLNVDGQQVGRVVKRVERYNLVRSITSTTWVLTMEGFERTSHNRRQDAIRQAQENLAHPESPEQRWFW